MNYLVKIRMTGLRTCPVDDHLIEDDQLFLSRGELPHAAAKSICSSKTTSLITDSDVGWFNKNSKSMKNSFHTAESRYKGITGISDKKQSRNTYRMFYVLFLMMGPNLKTQDELYNGDQCS